MPKAIIIGAGVAGMATAIRLAVQGFSVEVFERNGSTGGKLGHFNLAGYSFDAGPSLFTQPENIEELFTLAGENISDYLSYNKLPIACRYFYESGVVINAYTNTDAFAQEMHEKLGEDPQKIKSYLKQSGEVYDNIGRIFLDYSLHRGKALIKAPLAKAIKSTRGRYLFQSLHQLNQHYFTKPESVQLFNRFATYNGSNPYKAPGMLSLIPHLEQNVGTFYPQGGMISIARALHKLAEKLGVLFHLNSPVDRIIHHEQSVKGIVCGDENYYADVVVSNVDVYFTYNKLLRDERRSKKILKQERSSSACIFYWGIKKSFPQLQLHNIFFSKNYEQEFDHIFNKKMMYEDPTVYINITAKLEAGQAPAGKENWFVMVNAPANVGQNWEAFRNNCRQHIIDKLNRMLQTNLEELIEVEEYLDPVRIEQQTASYMGSLYGTSSNSRMAAFLRHPNFTSYIKGLYFAGGSVHPGGGIPLCLKSARLVSNMIAYDSKKRLHHHAH